MFSKP
jgi:hypothetical protein